MQLLLRKARIFCGALHGKGIAVLSETASNVTMAQGVALCRAKEKTGAVFMLAENYPFMRSNLELKRLYDEEVWDAFSMRRASTITRQARTI